MKKSVVAILISATLVVSALLAACGQPAPNVPAALTVDEGATQEVLAAPVAPTDEERLTAMQSSIGMLINSLVNSGQVAPDYLFEQTQRIEQARQALRQLDGQREGLSTLVMQYCVAGTAVPDSIMDLMDTVKQSREETLKGIGLYP